MRAHRRYPDGALAAPGPGAAAGDE